MNFTVFCALGEKSLLLLLTLLNNWLCSWEQYKLCETPLYMRNSYLVGFLVNLANIIHQFFFFLCVKKHCINIHFYVHLEQVREIQITSGYFSTPITMN